ncbi:hypothetical protein KP509_21G035100 [Ceratopteris richardii]|nr:hypothetical protein KP509_21G035100 [Ceratopteris richardii]
MASMNIPSKNEEIVMCGHSRKSEHQAKESFEEEASRVKLQALWSATMNKYLNFLCVALLTWATVVVLGGFVGDLSAWDFYLVTVMAFAQILQLFILRVNTRLLPYIIFTNKTVSKQRFDFDWQHVLAKLLYIYVQVAITCICTGFLCATVLRVSKIRSHPLPHGTRNLAHSLWIFYTLAFILSIVGILSALFRVSYESIRHRNLDGYYDMILREAARHGLVEASKVQLADCAFAKICESLKAGVHPLVVQRNNRQLIHYLYSQRGGICMACEILKSGDLWMRAAAACLPGFWVGEQTIKMQNELFWGLREVMYGGDVDAEFAISSVQYLAGSWSDKISDLDQKHPFLADDPMAGTNIVDTLVEIILRKIRPTLSFQIKALAACCRHPLVLQHFYQNHVRELSTAIDTSERTSRSNIGRRLEVLVVSEEQRRLERKDCAVNNQSNSLLHKSKLERLCMKLCDIISPSKNIVSIGTKIHAMELLLSLLLYGNNSVQNDALQVLVTIAESMVGAIGQNISPIDLESIKSMERVRCLLSLEQVQEWHKMEVLVPESSDTKALLKSR